MVRRVSQHTQDGILFGPGRRDPLRPEKASNISYSETATIKFADRMWVSFHQPRTSKIFPNNPQKDLKLPPPSLSPYIIIDGASATFRFIFVNL